MEKVIDQAYALLDKVTPLRTDCGRLCNRACCQDGPEETGMYLFPGEEPRLATASFLRIEPSGYEYAPGRPVMFAVCSGNCDRRLRPLACRVFPLTPYLNGKGIPLTILDPRGTGICPLIRQGERSGLNAEFVKAVRKTAQILLEHPECQAYLTWLSGVINEYQQWLTPRSRRL